MASHRFSVLIGVASIFLGLETAPVHAQAPPRVESETPGQTQGSPLAEQKVDAAAEALRSLYVAGGLTSTQAVTQIVATSPDLDRTKTLLLDAKGGAMQAMSALVPRLELLGRYSRLSPVDNSGVFAFENPLAPGETLEVPFDPIPRRAFVPQTRSVSDSPPAHSPGWSRQRPE